LHGGPSNTPPQPTRNAPVQMLAMRREANRRLEYKPDQAV